MNMEKILIVDKLIKNFKSGERELTVLQEVSFEVKSGETLSIVGPSGSGKTTLLSLCAGLDVPSAGEISICGNRLNHLSEDERALVRNRHTGFIFQNFQLLPTLTAIENVSIPMELRGAKGVERQAKELLDRVGLADRAHHYPSQLSGGEQQRVSLARAFITSPELLFADEPTGNLDEENAAMVSDLLFNINKESGTTLILVTHNLELARKTGRILNIKGGKIIREDKN